ncbi:MAG TPA: PAS domain S-box protein, partial [Chthoniobacteraceae bacterium]
MHVPPSHSSVSALRRFRGWLAAENYFYGKLFGASVAAVGAIMLLAAIFIAVTISEQNSGAQRDLTLHVLRMTDRLESGLASLENVRRDYLQTTQPAVLVQIGRRKAAMESHLAELTQLVSGSPEDLRRVQKIQADITTWMETFTPGASANPDALGETAPNVGYRNLLENVRMDIASFGRSKAHAFEEANSRAELQRIMQTSGFGVLCFIAITLLIASSRYSFVVFKNHLRRVESAQTQTRSIVQTTLDAVLTVDEHGMIRSINPSGEKMFGEAAEKLLGEPISRLIPQRHFFSEVQQVGSGTITAEGRRPGAEALFPVELSVSSMHVDGSRQYVAIIRDITERRRSEETLKHISLGVSAATGAEFVKSLSEQLSRALQSDFAFIVEIAGAGRDATNTLTLSEQGKIHSVGTFDLTHTACSVVLEYGFRACLENARGHFPDDALLAGLEIESLVALPLVDHNGRAVGVMGVLGRKPMENVQVIESTLQIFAARAAAELERKRFAEDLAAEKDRLAVTL